MIGISTAMLISGLCMAAAALIWAAWSDMRRYTIPNRIPALLAVSYAAGLSALSPVDWFMGLATGAVILIIGAVLFAQKLVGGGDVKLAASAGLWVGPSYIPDFILMTSLSGVLLGILMLTTPLPRLFGGSEAAVPSGLQRLSQPMPFGVPIAAGGLWVVALHLASVG